MAYPTLAAKDAWFATGATAAGITKNSITEINIVDSYTPSTSAKSWDGSDGNGGVTVYVEGGKLTIAGNGSGKVYANADSSSIFKSFMSLVIFNSGVLDTSKVTTLEKAFYDDVAIECLDLTTWDVRNVTTISNAFNSMIKLKTLLINNWVTDSLTNCRNAFQCCKSLEVLDLSGWDFSSVTTMYGMFGGIAGSNAYYKGYMNLKKIIGMENWDVRNVTDMTGLFGVNQAMERINLSRWNNAKCTQTGSMMKEMLALKEVIVGKNFNFIGNPVVFTAPNPDYIEGADGNWYDITGKSWGQTDVPSGVNRAYYASLPMVEALDVIVKNKSLLDTAKAIKERNGLSSNIAPSEFYEVIMYPILSASFLSAIKKETSAETIRFVTKYDGKYTISWPADDMKTGSITGYLDDKTVIISSNGANKIRLSTNASNLFANLPLLKTIEGLSILDASCVKFFDNGFSNCSALLEIDLSELNFSENLVSYDQLFSGCYRLKKATLWNGVNFVSSRMFYACLELEEIHGLSNVTEIGTNAFVHCTNFMAVDIDASKVTEVGDMACRRSNIEDFVDFGQSPLTTIGVKSIRSNRWNTNELSVIQNFFNEKNYKDVFIEVPNPDYQYNYPHVQLGYYGDNDELVCMATWGCSVVATYHEWNAVYNSRKEYDKVYPNFETWWNEVVCNDKDNNYYDYANNHPGTSSSGILPDIRKHLGWTSAERSFVESVAQLETIANRLTEGYPVCVSVYSSNTLTGLHAILVIGMKPQEGKIAVLDSSVVGHKGVISWLRFEDLFVRKSWAGDGTDEDKYFGADSIRMVSDYNLPVTT